MSDEMKQFLTELADLMDRHGDVGVELEASYTGYDYEDITILLTYGIAGESVELGRYVKKAADIRARIERTGG